MFLSKRANGIYYIFYEQENGKRTCTSTKCRLKKDAIMFLSKFDEEMLKKKIENTPKIALADYCEQFLYHSKKVHTSKTYKGYKYSIERLLESFPNSELKEITQSKMQEYFQKMMQQTTIYQLRRELICFNSFFNRAVEFNYLQANPCRIIKSFRIPQKLPTFFSEDEFELLLNQVEDQDIRDLIIFGVQTGLRQMEIITLKWEQINMKENYAILDNSSHITKSKKIRTIPLSTKVVEILKSRESKRIGELVFTYKSKQITQDFITHKFKFYVREAKINSNLKFHSLRHTFSSWLVQRGVSIYEVSKLLGHSRVEVTQIYSHLRAEDLRSAINVLNK